MASRSPRSDRVQGGSVFQRALSAVRSPFGLRGPAQRTASDGDDRLWARHQGARSSSVGVPGWDTREHSFSARRPSRTPFVITCETCASELIAQQAERCYGCGKDTHYDCQDDLKIGDLFWVTMCFVCSSKVSQWIRIVEVVELRHSRDWRKDDWMRTMIATANNNLPLVDTGNPTRNQLEGFWRML